MSEDISASSVCSHTWITVCGRQIESASRDPSSSTLTKSLDTFSFGCTVIPLLQTQPYSSLTHPHVYMHSSSRFKNTVCFVLFGGSHMLYYLAVNAFPSNLQFPFTVPFKTSSRGHAVSTICLMVLGSCVPPAGPVSDWISQGSLHLDHRSENITLSYAG